MKLFYLLLTKFALSMELNAIRALQVCTKLNVIRLAFLTDDTYLTGNVVCRFPKMGLWVVRCS